MPKAKGKKTKTTKRYTADEARDLILANDSDSEGGNFVPFSEDESQSGEDLSQSDDDWNIQGKFISSSPRIDMILHASRN